ncbi:MAG: hypothetical protein KDC98_17495, partial [Planctomycetes bacterium]|nr:hypothetical protein [Planctomycetota bacterium]
ATFDRRWFGATSRPIPRIAVKPRRAVGPRADAIVLPGLLTSAAIALGNVCPKRAEAPVRRTR